MDGPQPLLPKNWNPTINSLKREPPFDELNNPGRWSSFTYRPLFQPKGGYMCHTMPAGATAVPVDEVTGKCHRPWYWRESYPS
jgi:hypothetical protein